ncbi:MAG TPA: DUF3105 domain-containing protein [Anaerolineales bacterium]|nr:DUF3105 domain-containing protein [Anaerolineales bacterium]
MSRLKVGLFIALLLTALMAVLSACSSDDGILQEELIEDEGRSHVVAGSPLAFNNYPPTSGTHYESSMPWGVYEETQLEGYWVHNLEHGGVVLLYNCPEGCPELKQDLEDFYSNAALNGCSENRVIVMPYSEGMKTPITLLAWRRRLDLEQYDRKKIEKFYVRYEENGPENIPCNAGVQNMPPTAAP